MDPGNQSKSKVTAVSRVDNRLISSIPLVDQVVGKIKETPRLIRIYPRNPRQRRVAIILEDRNDRSRRVACHG